MCEDFNGYYMRVTFAKRIDTGVYEKIYILRDMSIGSRLVGIFDEDYKVDRYWNKVYIPSKRSEIQVDIGSKWDLDIDTLPIHYTPER